jgi:dihydrofolate synthase/folylpolyglutamate synthase
VVERATDLGCAFRRFGRDFQIFEHGERWDYRGSAGVLTDLRTGSVAPHNAALALEAAAALIPVTAERAAAALAAVTMPGRFEIRALPGDRLLVVDVAHNPSGAAFLARRLASAFPGRRFVAVLGMLADKDTAGVVAALADQVAAWVCLPTPGERGLSAQALAERVAAVAGEQGLLTAHDAGHGLEQALSACAGDDGILAFGSFSLVEQVRDRLDSVAAMDLGA